MSTTVKTRRKTGTKTPVGKAKVGAGSLRSALNEATPEEKAEILEMLREFTPEDAPAPVVEKGPEPGVIAQSYNPVDPNQPTLEQDIARIDLIDQTMQRAAKMADDDWANVTDTGARQRALSRKESVLYFVPVISLAREIANQDGGRKLRKWACRKNRQHNLSGRDVMPDIKFSGHTYSTSDPLLIARMMHYMDNPGQSDEPIEEIEPEWDVVVDGATGDFRQFLPGTLIDDVVADSSGTLKRPRP